MKMTIPLFCSILMLSDPWQHQKSCLQNSRDYQVDWTKTSHWKLYSIPSKHAFGFSFDTLPNFKSRPLDQNSMQIFLGSVTALAADRIPVWMGYYVTSCQLPDGRGIKVEISQYGGFFYDEKEHRYYEISLEVRKDWLAFFDSNMNALQSQ
jgi:hypothetical protein